MRELTGADLCPRCDPERFAWETTAELPDLDGVFGQDDAVEALRFGLQIRHEGYHLFVLGPVGVGRHHLVQRLLEAHASDQDVGDDWVYVHRFGDAGHPNAIRLPAADGVRFAADMAHVVEELPAALQAAFASDDVQGRSEALKDTFRTRQQAALQDVVTFAEGRSISVVTTPQGVAVAPVHQGEIQSPADVEALAPEDRATIRAALQEVQQRLTEVAKQVPKWESELREGLKQLERETTVLAVAHLIEGVRRRWQGHEELGPYLSRVQEDIATNAGRLRQERRGLEGMLAEPEDVAQRYLVNVLVDRTDQRGAPVVTLDDPTLPALVGRVEHKAVLGALRTDHMLIRPGALHRANGGYLVLDALKVLSRPLAWEHLKQALRARELRFGTVADYYGTTQTVTLEPEPIPLDLKVVLIGDRRTYHQLSALDPELDLLFKVAVDLRDRVDRGDGGEDGYARLVATLAREDRLLPFARDAVAAVIQQASRLAGDQHKLTTHLDSVTDLLREADHLARAASREAVTGADVLAAIDGARKRGQRVRDEMLEATLSDVLHVVTEGAEVGQVNGLSVLQVGRVAFGRPSRITARVRLGSGKVLDIEREVELGGPIHSKGVLILTGYLGGRYSPDAPLALAASLVFEQSYGGVDGDSASLAETVALLSVLADLPVRQDVAVTGSIDQRGRVQAVGGVNEKIEGFFDLCAARGLTGSQGVILPESNVRHLILRDHVVAAVQAGRFHVWGATEVDDAVALLCERSADEVHARVSARLAQLAEAARAFSGG